MGAALGSLFHPPTSSSHFPDNYYCNSHPRPHFFVTCAMSDQIGSSRFEDLFECALHDYEKQTGIPLAKHPLAEQFQNCQSVDSVATLLEEQARVFNEFRKGDKIMKYLKSVVSVLFTVSAFVPRGHAPGTVCPWSIIGRST